MNIRVEDLEDESKFRQILKVPYDELINFVIDYIKRRSDLMVFFWSLCIVFLGFAAYIRLNIAGYFPLKNILLHSLLGLIVFPLILIPVHEMLHAITFRITGAKQIKAGMDLRQYMFYVTAHRHVVNSRQFRWIGYTPFAVISLGLLLLILFVPGLWKWSLSILLLVHATMCTGDFAMMNFFRLNRKKKLYTWDDAEKKIAYFYEEI